jgi:hypothetical protein
MPPRTAVLQWPNGKKTAGVLTSQGGTAPAFFANQVDGPLANRRVATTQPGPIEVEIASTHHRAGRVRVTPRLMDQVPGVSPQMLIALADAAGGGDRGTHTTDKETLSRLMHAAVGQVAGNCTDPVAVGRVLRALEQPFVEFTLLAEGDDDRYEFLGAEYDATAGLDLPERLQDLEQGEHLLTRIVLERETGGAHALAISATRLSDSEVRLSLINSNGWRVVAQRDGFEAAPAIAKTVSLNAACMALESLRDGFEPPAEYQSSPLSHDWHRLAGGAPLYAWLDKVPSNSRLMPTRDRMRPQKGQDCAIETEFAWLATVLPRADYKLAKAHVLNALLQAAMTNGLGKEVQQRLRDRVTTSLSAHAMETGR